MDERPATRALEIAERLIGANRAQEALSWIEKMPPHSEWFDDRPVWLEIKALELLGQKEKAQKVRWQAFEKSMDERFYVEYADNVHTDERDTIRKKASEAAFCQLNPYRAMKFLTWLRDAPALKTLVLNHRNILDGNHYRELTPAADFLSPEEPETAALLYRLMVQRVLDRGSSQHYVYAARNLRKAESCSRNFREEQTTVPGHSDFLRDLKAKHGRKYRFWEQVEKIAINA